MWCCSCSIFELAKQQNLSWFISDKIFCMSTKTNEETQPAIWLVKTGNLALDDATGLEHTCCFYWWGLGQERHPRTPLESSTALKRSLIFAFWENVLPSVSLRSAIRCVQGWLGEIFVQNQARSALSVTAGVYVSDQKTWSTLHNPSLDIFECIGYWRWYFSSRWFALGSLRVKNNPS